MEESIDCYELLLRQGADRLKGHERRLFMAEVTLKLCAGNARKAERRFGWGRETVSKGIHELQQGVRCLENFAARARPRLEEKTPGLAQDIRAIVEPHTQADPELRSTRCYRNLSAADVLEALQTKGYKKENLPSERSMRDILNRMNYRLKRIQKGKPLKKTAQTNAIFANVQAVKKEIKRPDTLEISVDTKAKVNEGDYAVEGKTRTGADGKPAKGWDHDPPAKLKWTPLGILMLATGALTIIFGSQETSDFWIDGLKMWWLLVKDSLPVIRRLVIYLDNGPNNSGSRTQFLKRMFEFADWSGLEIRLVYYPPYHSKYNPIERCWSSLDQKWGGALLSCLKVILQQARRMRWCGQRPTVKRLHGEYPDGIRLTKKETKPFEARLDRSTALPKYDITIRPSQPRCG